MSPRRTSTSVLSSEAAVSEPKYTTSMPRSRSRQVAARAMPVALDAFSTSTRNVSSSPGMALDEATPPPPPLAPLGR